MEIHQINYFLEVARQGNFSRAAETCNVSQPTLSHQIKKLEEELEEVLFKRLRSGTVLTEYGEIFFLRALRIQKELQAIEQEAMQFQKEVAGKIRLGAIPTIAPYLLPKIIKQTLKKYPEINFQITEDTTDNLLTNLRLGKLDFALVSPPLAHDQDIATVHLFDDELLLAIPGTHKLAKKRKVDLSQLKEFPLVLLKEEHCLSIQTLNLCNLSNIQPRIEIESSQLETVVAMIESGFGLSLIPSMARSFLQKRKVEFSSIGPKPVHRQIGLAMIEQAKLTRTHQAFVEFCRNLF